MELNLPLLDFSTSVDWNEKKKITPKAIKKQPKYD
jgi:hypothetical protein